MPQAFDPGPQPISDYISDINRLIIGLNQRNATSIPLVLMPFGAADMRTVLNRTVQGLNSALGLLIPYFTGPQDTSAFLSLINALSVLAAGPANALALNGVLLALNGQYLTLGN